MRCQLGGFTTSPTIQSACGSGEAATDAFTKTRPRKCDSQEPGGFVPPAEPDPRNGSRNAMAERTQQAASTRESTAVAEAVDGPGQSAAKAAITSILNAKR
jgi:hypothetical protein